MPNQPNDNAEHGGLAGRVATLEALSSLQDVMSRYARFADLALGSPSHEHAVALADLFTDDATADYGPFFGSFSGRAALINAFENILPAGTRWSAHYVVNPLLEVSGDTAQGTWAFLIHAVPRNPPDAGPVTFYGRYEEQLRRVGGTWKIASLVVHYSSP